MAEETFVYGIQIKRVKMAIRSDTKCSRKSKDRVLADGKATGRVFGYIRVSTIKQDVEGQRYGILQWADERKLTITEWVEELLKLTTWNRKEVQQHGCT